MSKCMRCQSEKILTVEARSKDMTMYEWVNEVSGETEEYEGYPLEIFSSSTGDNFKVVVCLECGQVQSEFPKNMVDIFTCEDCGNACCTC